LPAASALRRFVARRYRNRRQFGLECVTGARVSFAEITTDKRHDAFLLDEPEFFAIVRGFLEGAASAPGAARSRHHP
jgi:hypothetical protein